MEIKIETEYVTLGQFLKLADLISSGGEAKFAVKEMDIQVNGEAENRRGRKLYRQDTVDVDGQSFIIV
ncbi:RNA-binding protein [Erysipelotrichaceae bacterium MTC7]|nr:RNA-binding protein [Erysipelotrichaceae bacterium MTC7]